MHFLKTTDLTVRFESKLGSVRQIMANLVMFSLALAHFHAKVATALPAPLEAKHTPTSPANGTSALIGALREMISGAWLWQT